MAVMTLKQFRYFEALAREGHFGRAADACAISQPALSMQIKELEESAGAKLFERSAKQVCLTGFGEKFAVRVREILGSVNELTEFARASKHSFLSSLRIGVIPTIAPYLLPTIIGNLTLKHPGLDLQIRETQTEKLIKELEEGRLDAAIVALPISEPSLTEVALFSEDFVLVRNQQEKDLPIPDGKKLREMRLLLLEEGHCFRDQALSFCNIRSGLSREGLEGSSLTTLVQMVGAGIGVTLIPEMAVPVETRSADVSIAHFKSPKPSRIIGMIWRKTSPMVEQLKEISEIVKQSATLIS